MLAPERRSSRPAVSTAPPAAPENPRLAKPFWYNDWRQVDMPSLAAFTPALPVSVIVPYYAQPQELARTLAALEGQTYPRPLFEVVVVDDGSPQPPAHPPSTPLDVKVVRQQDPGLGLARARNTGAGAAAHDVLLFLDADMLPEAGWLAAHARWHHAVPDAVTLGLHSRVSVDGVDAAMISNRPGTLKELFAGRDVTPTWREVYWASTNDLTTRADDLFRVVTGGNLGIRRGFYEMVGGFDESFTRRGGEDLEFGYRAYTRGGLLAPARGAFVWRQRPWEDERMGKEESPELQRAKLGQLIAHPRYRTALTGRTFRVPQYVVTIQGEDRPASSLLGTVEGMLSGPMQDLVVRLELSGNHADKEWLERYLGADPRVRVAPSRPALEEFPASPFHVTLPPDRPLRTDVVHRLRTELGTGVIGESAFADGARASVVRAWALHRAARTTWQASEFGEVVTIPPDELQPQAPTTAPADSPATGDPWHRKAHMAWERLRAELRQVDDPVAAWRFVSWFAGAVLRRYRGTLPRAAPSMPAAASIAAVSGALPFPPRAEYPLGVEIAALGPRSQAVFAAAGRMVRTMDGQRADAMAADTADGQHIDLVVVDTAAEAAAKTAPAVILAKAPPMLSTPAFDPRTDNPIGWLREVRFDAVGALGPLDLLPPDCWASRIVRRDDRWALRRLHHLEDVAAFHADTLTRAGELARLAATGVVVHLADADRNLAPYLGAALFELMTHDPRSLDLDGRETLSVRMRREALRTHSLASRARQIAERTLADPPRLPLVSILLATRRPQLLERALAAVRRQTYPRLELVLGLHGEGFGAMAPEDAGLSVPVTALRLDAALPLGSVLNAATDASCGTLLAKMDDDDMYGPDHIWDLVLAHEYSQAPMVGKAGEFMYLAACDRTIRRFSTGGERFEPTITGGALLIERHMLDRVGGWRRCRVGEEVALAQAVLRTGAPVYRMHPHGLALVRHEQPTWTVDDAFLLAQADVDKAGWRPDMGDIGDVQLPWCLGRQGHG